ncbi:MAG: response regulator [Bacteroidia bacterium]|nr:response regulator [Bacteroidia bacterium]
MKRQYRKVFIAEDNPVYRLSLEAALGNLYEEVHSFVSGEELLKALHEDPDLILLDHHFVGGQSGLEILTRIKGYNPGIQVIFLSGQEEVKVAVESLKRGAFDYVVKGAGEIERLHLVLDRLESVTRQARQENRPFWKKLFPISSA